MLFENMIEYNQAAAQALVEADSRVLHRKSFLARRAVLLAVGLAALACGGLLLLAFAQLDAASRGVCVCDLLISVLLLGKGLSYRRVMVRRVMRGTTGGVRRAVFSEEEIQVEQPGVQRGAFCYSAVAALYETEDYFILPLSTGPKGRGPSIVLDKGGFTRGTAGEFRDFIQERTGMTARFVDWK